MNLFLPIKAPICPTATSWYGSDQNHGISALTVQAMKVLKQVVNAQGFNRDESGGSQAPAFSRTRTSTVPRYGGDANFLPIIAQTKAIQTADARQLMAENWESVD